MSGAGSGTETVSSGEGARTLTAADIAAAVNGEIRGDPTVRVSGVAPLNRAGATDLTFLAAERYAPLLAGRSPGVLLVSPELAESGSGAACTIVVANPQEALVALLPRLYRAPRRAPGVHHTAVIARGASIGRNVAIGPFAVVGAGAVIGDDSTIDAHVVIGDGVRIGASCHLFPHVTLYSGAVFGERVIAH